MMRLGFSFFSSRASVEQNHIGFISKLSRLKRFARRQNIRHLLRVVLVHLATEGFDVNLFHRYW
jgi:hypothetical protein